MRSVEADLQVGLPAYKPEEVQPRNEEGDESTYFELWTSNFLSSAFAMRMLA